MLLIWVGDNVVDSSRILEFNLTSGRFIEHKLNGTCIVIVAFNHDNNSQIWYVADENESWYLMRY